jgi:methylisocitrate lyase
VLRHPESLGRRERTHPGAARLQGLATTSAGFAWSLGKRDNHVSLDEALVHVRGIAASVSVPVNADFERGFADQPRDVAANVARAAETGIAGLSIEDSTGDSSEPLRKRSRPTVRFPGSRKRLHPPR